MQILEDTVTTAYRIKTAARAHSFAPPRPIRWPAPPSAVSLPLIPAVPAPASARRERRIGVIALTAAIVLFGFALGSGDADLSLHSLGSMARAVASHHQALTDRVADWMTAQLSR